MSDVQIGLGGVALLFLLIALRFHIGFVLLGVSFAGLWLLGGWPRARSV